MIRTWVRALERISCLKETVCSLLRLRSRGTDAAVDLQPGSFLVSASALPRTALRACLSLRFQGLTPTPQYQSSASSRLWPARPAALCLPNPCRLGSDSHGVKVFLGKLLKFLTQTGSYSSFEFAGRGCASGPCLIATFT